jgi:uncharacterized membrane protein YfcA
LSDLRLTPDIMHRFVLPGTAALIAGAINAMAGGGSFLSFPALLGAGIPPVNANTTNTVAMWPGELTSVFAFRSELRTSTELRIPVMTAGGVGVACPIFCAIGRVSVAQLFLSASSRRRGCGEVGSA